MRRTERIIVWVTVLVMVIALLPIHAEAAKTSKKTKAVKVVKPGKVTMKQITTGGNMTEGEITVSWGKLSCAGYQIEYADNRSFERSKSWSCKGSGTVSHSFTCLREGSEYWFRARAYNTSGSQVVYGAWGESKSIVAHSHEYMTQIRAEPSCGVAGIEVYECSGCGYSYELRLSPLKHDYQDKVTTKATCKAPGVRTWTCSRCGDSYTEPVPAVTTHKPKKKGSKTVCKVCGKTLSKREVEAASGAGRKGTGDIAGKQDAKRTEGSGSEGSKAEHASDSKSSGQDANEKPDTKMSRTEKARQAAVDWAIGIANDNSFHYGRKSWAHHNGCYFCGTNQKRGSAKQKAGASASACAKTYCCNPFVTAAFKHGAGAKEIDCRVARKRINLANDSNRALNNKKAFSRIAKPKSVTSLKPGDILLTPTHAMLYAGDGKVVHASHHDNGRRGDYWNSSIKCGKISSTQWKRTTKIYRYKGTGRF